MHDKKIVEIEPIRYPAGTILYKDTGFQGDAPKVQQSHQPKKSRARARYPVDKSATIARCPASGSGWSMPWRG